MSASLSSISDQWGDALPGLAPAKIQDQFIEPVLFVDAILHKAFQHFRACDQGPP